MKGKDSWQSLSSQTPKVSIATQEVFDVTGAWVPGLQFWKVSGSPLAQRDQVLFFFWRPIQEVLDTLLAMATMLSELTVTKSLKQAWQTDRQTEGWWLIVIFTGIDLLVEEVKIPACQPGSDPWPYPSWEGCWSESRLAPQRCRLTSELQGSGESISWSMTLNLTSIQPLWETICSKMEELIIIYIYIYAILIKMLTRNFKDVTNFKIAVILSVQV